MEIIQLFDKPTDEMDLDELKRELRVQKYVRQKLVNMAACMRYKHKETYTEEDMDRDLEDLGIKYLKGECADLGKYHSEKMQIGIKFRRQVYYEDKIEMLGRYEKALDGLIEDLQYYIDYAGKYGVEYFDRDSGTWKKSKENKTNLKRWNLQVFNYETRLGADGIGINWDRDKFDAIARDRGYFTSTAVIHKVKDELGLDVDRAKILLQTGRFTWGQVLCIGALFEMTPKEFCDTFLAGYFVDSYGQFIASYENLDKENLLEKPVVPKQIRKREEQDEPEEQESE